MTDPYLIHGPALISFSGGRTSGYMLKHILDAHGGALPDDVKVTFANTGKEMPETLDFVQECASRWNVPIVWLEWRDRPKGEQRFDIVSHNSASRNGEPFTALINKRGYLPNPITRFCTTKLKIETMKHYAMDVLGWTRWDNVVGLRADEPIRVSRSRARTGERWEMVLPLADAGASRADVTAFWQWQGFDLRLPNNDGNTPLGNCDLCFLKGGGNHPRHHPRAPRVGAMVGRGRGRGRGRGKGEQTRWCEVPQGPPRLCLAAENESAAGRHVRPRQQHPAVWLP